MPLAVPTETIEEFSKYESPEEFAAAVLRKIDVDKIDVMLNRVLTAAYIGHERSAGSGLIIKPFQSIAEDIWQGKASLVLKVGPAAFKDHTYQSFYGQQVKPGDWVTFKIGNSHQVEICKVPCRIVEDRFIEAVYPDPRHITS